MASKTNSYSWFPECAHTHQEIEKKTRTNNPLPTWSERQTEEICEKHILTGQDTHTKSVCSVDSLEVFISTSALCFVNSDAPQAEIQI